MKLLVVALAGSVAAAPALAAPLEDPRATSNPRVGAVVGPYFSVPLGGDRSGKPQLGLRMRGVHDYRASSAPAGLALTENALDLRLVGDGPATFYVGGTPVTGKAAEKNNLVGSGIVKIGILALAAVGAFVIYDALDDDEDRQCFIPEGCP